MVDDTNIPESAPLPAENTGNTENSAPPSLQALTGRDLLEAVQRAEFGYGFEPEDQRQDQGPDQLDQYDTGQESSMKAPPEIPLEVPEIPLEPHLLAAPEIEALMRTDAYRTWYHPHSEKVRSTVSKWFEITYPGPINVDSSGRMIRSDDRLRPQNAPAALAKHGPLSLQHAKRLTPRKPSYALTTSHQDYAKIIDEYMNAWHQKHTANTQFSSGPKKNVL